MRQRCSNPNASNYARYGGRGISVCALWAKDFWAFVDYIGPRPIGSTLDRIDNEGDYEPGNVRWATNEEQARNRRNNKKIELFGESKTVGAWAQVHGLRKSTIASRLAKGWSAERAILTPRLVPVTRYVSGAQFGYWTLVERAEQDAIARSKGGTKSLWVVRCVCGTEAVRRLTRLKDGRSKSCGCSGRLTTCKLV
jgi:hypothetical protein